MDNHIRLLSLLKTKFSPVYALLCLSLSLSINVFAQTQSAAVSPTPTPTPTPAAKPSAKPAAAPAPIKLGSLTLSGSVRARLENWDWYDTTAADDTYNFGAIVLRVAIGQTKEKFEWQIEGEAPVLINLPERSIAPAPQGQLGLGATYFAANGRQDASGILKQAFVRFKGVFGNAPSSLKIGRFEFSDGSEVAPADATLAALKQNRISQRLIGPFAFTHVGRSFDGLQYVYNTKAANFTFLAVRPTVGAFDLDANKELDVDMWYGAFTKPLKHKSGESEYRLFALHYHDGRRVLKTDNRTQALRQADVENIRITSLGGHYVGAYKTGSGKTDVLLWGLGQFGTWGRLDHRAAAIAAEIGYQPGGQAAAKIKPWLRAGYFRSTGDGDATDNTHGTFFQAMPTPRIYARFPFFNLMNNEDSFVQLSLKPHAKLALRTDAHYLRLSSTKDLWYLGGGAFQKQTFGYVGRPSLNKNSLGWLADVSADYTLSPRTTFSFYFGGSVGGSVQKAIYPLGNRSHFAYVELTQKF